ncbi:hypothetical protein E2562_019376 [Oryza meyeriana var. granulata]|uniref:Retroviral polymerase SH3-like domain-containing protein n=1 Tax=Oryza meyeriana var. granulata TaxID=110450 RepID=A0A6G1BMA6_9ORYZ|nr:hypothetical protein E2562_019376 [Oryza meyeriana var. granulata]
MKAYRVLDPRTWRVRLARHVIFDESHGWDWMATSDAGAPPRSDFTIEYHVEQTTGYPVPGSGGDAIPPSATSTLAQNAASPSPATPTTAKRPATIEFVSPPSHDEERLDAAHSDTPVRYRTVDNLIGEDALGPGLAQRELEEESLLLTGPGEPCSFAEAERDEAWRATMQEEMDAALRAYNAKLDRTLKALGFEQSKHEHTMYRRNNVLELQKVALGSFVCAQELELQKVALGSFVCAQELELQKIIKQK